MTSLEKKLYKIKKVIDARVIADCLSGGSLESIKKYYTKNKRLYRIFHSPGGYIHMGITRSGEFNKKDLLEPALEISSFIKAGDKVLELASGHGANTALISKMNTGAKFYALDWSTKPSQNFFGDNTDFSFGDYHDLSSYEENAFDVVFVIEALCHSSRKEVVLKEVSRVLKKGGRFIVYDGYRSDKGFSGSELEALDLAAKGMAVKVTETVSELESKSSRYFEIESREDLSNFVLPSMTRLYKRAAFFYSLPLLKYWHRYIPTMMLQNTFSGYLMPDLMRQNITTYYKHVFRKR